MRKIFVIICVLLIFTGCEKNKKTIKSEFADGLNISSVLEPETFTEKKVEFQQNGSVEDVYTSDTGIYISMSDPKEERLIKLLVLDPDTGEKLEINTDIECSYIYDLCCSETRIYICYQSSGKVMLGALNTESNELCSVLQTDYLSNNIKIVYCKQKIYVSYSISTETGDSIYTDLYDEELNLIQSDIDLLPEYNSDQYKKIICSEYDSELKIMCLNRATNDLEIISYSLDNGSIVSADSGIDIQSGYVPDLISGMDKNRVFLKYIDTDSDTTYANIYDLKNNMIIDMYQFEELQHLCPASEKYNFFICDEGIIYGYQMNSELPIEICSEPDDFSLIDSFYDYRNKKIIMYEIEDDRRTFLYKINGETAEVVADLDSKKLNSISVSETDDVYAIIEENEKFSIFRVEDTMTKCFELAVPQEAAMLEFCVSGNNFYFLIQDDEYYLDIYNASGVKTNSVKLDSMINLYKIVRNSNNGIKIYANSYDGNVVFNCSNENLNINKLDEYLTFNYMPLCTCNDKDDLFFYDSKGIYSYNIGNSEISKVFDFSSQLTGCSPEKIAVTDKNTIVFAGTDYITSSSAVSILSRAEINDSLKNVITVAEVGNVNAELRRIFREYNAFSQDKNIIINNYINQEKLNEDIGKGKIPDIVTFDSSSGFNLKKYISQGFVEELDEYLNNDEKLNSDDLFLNVFKENGYQDNIYQIGSSVSFTAANCIQSVDDEITVNNLIKLGDKYGKNFIKPFTYGSASQILIDDILSEYILGCIDYEKSSLNINGNVISSIFRLSRMYYEYEKEESNDDAIIEFVEIYDFSHSYNYLNLKPLRITEGQSYQVGLKNNMILMKHSENKKEAWNIMHEILMDDYQNRIAESETYCFPVNKKSLDKMAENRRDYEVKNRKTILDDAYVSFIKNILENSIAAESSDKYISDMIDNIFSEYCSGALSDKEAEDKLIMSLKKYINE